MFFGFFFPPLSAALSSQEGHGGPSRSHLQPPWRQLHGEWCHQPGAAVRQSHQLHPHALYPSGAYYLEMIACVYYGVLGCTLLLRQYVRNLFLNLTGAYNNSQHCFLHSCLFILTVARLLWSYSCLSESQWADFAALVKIQNQSLFFYPKSWIPQIYSETQITKWARRTFINICYLLRLLRDVTHSVINYWFTSTWQLLKALRFELS